MKRLTILWVALAIPLLGQNYKFDKFAGGGCGNAISSSGQVAGSSISGAFLWTRTGGLQFLGSLGGNGSGGAYAVNAGGEAAGTSNLPDGTGHAFFWTPSGGMQDIGSPLGGSSDAWAITDSGQVAGDSQATSDHSTHVFFWSQATSGIDIGTLEGSSDSVGTGFNNSGEIIGRSGGVAFTWTLATGIQPLAGFGGSGENAAAINDSGQVAGVSTYPDGTSHAALWSPNGNIQDLGTLPGDTSSGGLFINAAGHVAGYSTHLSGKQAIMRVFFWTPETGMIDTGAAAGALAVGLNSRNQILFDYTTPHGTYLWSPSLAVQKVASADPYLERQEFNDAGQYLGTQGHSCVVGTPIMHVSLSSSRNPSQAGQSVTFTANVSAIVGVPPDGEQVVFYNGGSVLGTSTLSNGVASLTTSTLKVGTHNIKAKYAGDANYYSSSSTGLKQVVN